MCCFIDNQWKILHLWSFVSNDGSCYPLLQLTNSICISFIWDCTDVTFPTSYSIHSYLRINTPFIVHVQHWNHVRHSNTACRCRYIQFNLCRMNNLMHHFLIVEIAQISAYTKCALTAIGTFDWVHTRHNPIRYYTIQNWFRVCCYLIS